jgi:arsenate reductase-like glutaredoxin family protein
VAAPKENTIAAEAEVHNRPQSSCHSLEELGADLPLRSLDAEPLHAQELDRLIGHRDYREFRNIRNQLYRDRNMKPHPPTRAEGLRLLSDHPNLIRRPAVIGGEEILLGYDEDAFQKLVKAVSGELQIQCPLK